MPRKGRKKSFAKIKADAIRRQRKLEDREAIMMMKLSQVPPGVQGRCRNFLEVFRKCGNITLAANRIGITVTQVHTWRKRYPEFTKNFDLAKEEAADLLEAEALRRAVNGVENYKFHEGVPLMDPSNPSKFLIERKFSDPLLIFLLRATRPEKFKDSHGDITHNHKIVLQPITFDGQPAPEKTLGKGALKNSERKQLQNMVVSEQIAEDILQSGDLNEQQPTSVRVHRSEESDTGEEDQSDVE